VLVRACRLEQLEEGKGFLVELGTEAVALFRAGGEVYALENDCPHRGAALAWGEVRGTTVHCPLHAWPFDLRTGICLEFPEAAVRRLGVEVRGGEVWVEL
jgi:nitrite reductase (NADH) small subunit